MVAKTCCFLLDNKAVKNKLKLYPTLTLEVKIKARLMAKNGRHAHPSVL